jgi:hypothetical protein
MKRLPFGGTCAGLFEFRVTYVESDKEVLQSDPLTIFITAMILITLLSLFCISTARPSNVSFNAHSGDSKRQLPERRL